MWRVNMKFIVILLIHKICIHQTIFKLINTFNTIFNITTMTMNYSNQDRTKTKACNYLMSCLKNLYNIKK